MKRLGRGEGKARTGAMLEAMFTVAVGDYVCFPAGQEVDHSFENPLADDCRILAIGPANPAEIAVYPHSGKAKLRVTQTIIRWPQEPLEYWTKERASVPLEKSGARNVRASNGSPP